MENQTKTIIMWCLITIIGVFAILAIVGQGLEKSENPKTSLLQKSVYEDSDEWRKEIVASCMAEGGVPLAFCECGADVMIREMRKGNYDLEKMLDKALTQCEWYIY